MQDPFSTVETQIVILHASDPPPPSLVCNIVKKIQKLVFMIEKSVFTHFSPFSGQQTNARPLIGPPIFFQQKKFLKNEMYTF